MQVKSAVGTMAAILQAMIAVFLHLLGGAAIWLQPSSAAMAGNSGSRDEATAATCSSY